jgi:electron transfer flavoprotein alpha/beta subunit
MAKPKLRLLNYTTKIDGAQTAGEILGLLVAKGAKSVSMDYQNGEPIALWFKIEAYKTEIAFRLPCNYEGVLRTLKRTAEPRFQNIAQAKRTGWRIVKDWIEAQLALVECEQAEMVEVFLPYAITANNQTLFQLFRENSGRLLGPGNPDQRGYNVVDGTFG